jgi:DNA-binding HxlR family transcriptional regulator/predicted transcriptional regulator
MANPNYTKDLFNVLKNKTRFRVMQTIINGKYSVSQLQQELKRAGHRHSQDNISREYLSPLVTAGLVAQVQDKYYSTHFGDRLTPLLSRFPDFAEQMPANSECYEEIVLQSMLTGSKTFEDIEALVPPKIVSRVLKRLRDARLVRTPKERDYVFFYKSKRGPDKEQFTETERKIYDAIAPQGVSVGTIAKKTRLSSRITYKYLRGLRGKKLIFSRKTPKPYRLTCRGTKLATSLSNIEKVVDDTWNCSQQLVQPPF